MEWLHAALALLAALGTAWAWLTSLCSATAQFLPAPRDGDARWYAVLYALVNGIAWNRGHARNAADPRG
jgi:hypothetical protein